MMNLFSSGLKCKAIQVKAIELHFLIKLQEHSLYESADFIKFIG
jgi:hypothetical protein